MAVLLLVSSGMVRPAAAQTGLINGASITVDGIDYTVGSCEYAVNGGTFPSGTNNSCKEGDVSGGAAINEMTAQGGLGSAILVTATGGGAIFASTTTSGNDQLKFTLTLSPGTGSTAKTTLTNMTTTLAGSASPSGSGDITDTITSSLPGVSPAFATLNLSNLTDINTFTKQTITSGHFGSSNPTLTEDLTLNTHTSTTISLTSLLIRLNPAPEPLSLSVFGVGLAGLGYVRRKRRKAA
jgi:hypothetical protein